MKESIQNFNLLIDNIYLNEFNYVQIGPFNINVDVIEMKFGQCNKKKKVDKRIKL